MNIIIGQSMLQTLQNSSVGRASDEDRNEASQYTKHEPVGQRMLQTLQNSSIGRASDGDKNEASKLH